MLINPLELEPGGMGGMGGMGGPQPLKHLFDCIQGLQPSDLPTLQHNFDNM